MPMNKTNLGTPFPRKVILSLTEKLRNVKVSRNIHKFYSLLWYSIRPSQLARRKNLLQTTGVLQIESLKISGLFFIRYSYQQ